MPGFGLVCQSEMQNFNRIPRGGVAGVDLRVFRHQFEPVSRVSKSRIIAASVARQPALLQKLIGTRDWVLSKGGARGERFQVATFSARNHPVGGAVVLQLRGASQNLVVGVCSHDCHASRWAEFTLSLAVRPAVALTLAGVPRAPDRRRWIMLSSAGWLPVPTARGYHASWRILALLSPTPIARALVGVPGQGPCTNWPPPLPQVTTPSAQPMAILMRAPAKIDAIYSRVARGFWRCPSPGFFPRS